MRNEDIRKNRTDIRVFKPTSAAVFSSILWDCAAVLPPALLAVTFEKLVLRIIFGAIAIGVALWMGRVSWDVLRTHFVTSLEGIISAGCAYSLGLSWEEITDVLIRQRFSGIQVGRPDRLVVLSATGDRSISLNTSVLTRQEENELLEIIKKNVQCHIRTITDSMWKL